MAFIEVSSVPRFFAILSLFVLHRLITFQSESFKPVVFQVVPFLNLRRSCNTLVRVSYPDFDFDVRTQVR